MEDITEDTHKLRSLGHGTIFETELIGLWLAFDQTKHKLIILPYDWTPDAIIINTDSQAAIETLQNHHAQYIIKEIIDVINDIRFNDQHGHIRIMLNWVTGHKDIEGNETAAQLANSARRILLPSL